MTLEKIHIKNRGTLVDFEAKFGPITVIYGPNASGKSLLSNALRSIEREKWMGPGEAEVTINGRTLSSGEFAQGEHKDRVRVFNADFLRDDVIDGDPSAIVLGRAVVDQRDEIDSLTKQISISESSIQASDEQMVQFKNSLGEGFQSAGAKVRTVLRTVPKNDGANPRWPNYDRRDAEKTYRAMLNEGRYVHHKRSPVRLEELEETILQRESPQPLGLTHVDDPSVSDIYKRATVLLHTNRETTSLPEVEGDPDRRDWLLKGQEYSRDEGQCAFCHQHVPPDRANALESYFNDNLRRLLIDIDSMDQELELKISTLASISLPAIGGIRSDLKATFEESSKGWSANIESAKTAIETVQSLLRSKRDQPNIDIEIDTEPPVWDTKSATELNRIVEEHNQSVDDLMQRCFEYERGVIANHIEEWKGLDDRIADLKVTRGDKIQDLNETKARLREVQRKADTRLIAADELTDMVRNFLGHDEIGFELNADDLSYQLTRNGEPANNFSEGERTALALMYFLKRLEDDSFDKRNGTIVFDDPITSFDEDNLFRAVAFIIDRTDVTAQGSRDKPKSFLVLTHHFGLLERLWWEFKNQRSGREGKPPRARFFQMRCTSNDSHRESKLEEIQQAVITEYQVAFDEVSSIAQGNTKINNPENSIRKCMEGFLIRVTPDYELDGALKTMQRLAGEMNADNPSSEQLRLLVNVANAGSHAGATIRHATLENGWHRLKQASKILLDLMRVLGQEHYRGMERLRNKRT